MNAWWFCSPTQLLILQKGKKKLLSLGGENTKRKKKRACFFFSPPSPNCQRTSSPRSHYNTGSFKAALQLFIESLQAQVNRPVR